MTRPMTLRSTSDHEVSDGDQLLNLHHRATLWIPWTILLLGIWLATSPSVLGYQHAASWASPSGGRGVWFSDATHDALRADLITWSDVVSGIALIALAIRMLKPDRPVAWWLACGVGVWLVAAPILLWSPSAAAFANDSLVGMLVIALTILVPGMPNMARYMQTGGSTPPGWSYNPSSWAQRSILIALGLVGLLASRALAAYQLGYVDQVWDPFFGFGAGTQQVLDSRMSHTWPVSDAGLGAVAYSFEFLMGFMGGPRRWRTMPWMVTIFGILVIPLGLSHIVLVMSQPVVVHEWCTLCLVAAAAMLPMIPLEVDEVVAMLQHVRTSVRRGDRGGSAWKIFWMGGDGSGSDADERSPDIAEAGESPRRVARASVWGMSAPPTLCATTALGVALLVAPAAFGVDIRSGAADVAHLGGAAVLVLGVTAMGEVIRSARLLSIPVGLGVASSVWLGGPDPIYGVAVTTAGLAVAVLSIPRGRITETYATWDRMIV